MFWRVRDYIAEPLTDPQGRSWSFRYVPINHVFDYRSLAGSISRLSLRCNFFPVRMRRSIVLIAEDGKSQCTGNGFASTELRICPDRIAVIVILRTLSRRRFSLRFEA